MLGKDFSDITQDLANEANEDPLKTDKVTEDTPINPPPVSSESATNMETKFVPESPKTLSGIEQKLKTPNVEDKYRPSAKPKQKLENLTNSAIPRVKDEYNRKKESQKAYTRYKDSFMTEKLDKEISELNSKLDDLEDQANQFSGQIKIVKDSLSYLVPKIAKEYQERTEAITEGIKEFEKSDQEPRNITEGLTRLEQIGETSESAEESNQTEETSSTDSSQGETYENFPAI